MDCDTSNAQLPEVGEQLELDRALAAVECLADEPIHHHVTAFETVHRLLQDQLAQTDDG